MPQTIYEVIWIFIIYSFIGWCTEVAYAATERGIFVNRGFLNGPYCPIYGCGVLIVVLVLEPIQENLIVLFFGSFLLTSIIEFLTGYILEKAFHNKWWDYSMRPFNIKGYVCLKFSILWGLACTFVVRIIHPIIYGFIKWIHPLVGTVLLIIIMIAFVADFVVTVCQIIKFNRKLKLMNEIAGKLKVISDNIAENVYDKVMNVLEQKAEFQELYADEIEEFDAKKDAFADSITGSVEHLRTKAEYQKLFITAGWKEAIAAEQAELAEKYAQLYQKKEVISNRLMKAFPDMKSKDYNDILQRLKNRKK